MTLSVRGLRTSPVLKGPKTGRGQGSRDAERLSIYWDALRENPQARNGPRKGGVGDADARGRHGVGDADEGGQQVGTTCRRGKDEGTDRNYIWKYTPIKIYIK